MRALVSELWSLNFEQYLKPHGRSPAYLNGIAYNGKCEKSDKKTMSSLLNLDNERFLLHFGVNIGQAVIK